MFVQFHNDWIEESWRWLVRAGLKEDLMAKKSHPSEGLAHYAKACTDIVFQYPFGTQVSLFFAV